jgi:hypothetical protein
MPKPPPDPEDKKLLLRVPEEWHEYLRRRAFEERTPIAELVRRALAAAYPDLPPRPDGEDEGRKGGEVGYRINPHTASALCDDEG